MAEKKKTVSGGDTNGTGTVIPVDTRKLSQGLKMTFEGVALVFDSLGVESGIPMQGRNEAESSSGNEKAEELVQKATVDDKADTAPVKETKEPKAEPAVQETESVEASDEAVEPGEDVKEVPAANTEPMNTVTLDDITKIIVQKIKKNRKNNEKIGAILKTYGAAKVGELSPSKYEAFLTDLASI